MSLLTELNRRNVTRTVAAYAAVAWLIIQIAETLLPVFNFSNGAIRIVAVLLAVGLVPTFVVSWSFEITPGGLKRDSDVDREAADSAFSRKRLDRFIVVVLAVAVSYFAIDKFLIDPARDAARERTIAEEARDAGREEALDEQFGGMAIAVLPLTEPGSNPDQAYLSFGISEDIVNLLASTREIRVIASSASFRYANSELSNQQIAEQIGATHLLRGAVRTQAEDVRVSVQLIDARSETLVWAETYERRLGDIFAIQEDVSARAVDSIVPTLSDRLADHRQPEDAEDYLEYLQARYLYQQGRRTGDATMVRSAMSRYEKLLSHSPNSARAHAGLADAWGFLAIIGDVEASEGYARSRAAAQQALDLNDNIADAWLALADAQFEYYWNFPAASESYRRALQLEPQNAEGMRSYAFFLSSIGDVSTALDYYRDSLIVDPLSVRAYVLMMFTQLESGDYDGAESTLDEIESLAPGDWTVVQRHIHIWQSDFEAAAALLPDEPQGVFDFRDAAYIERARGNPDRAEKLIAKVLDFETALPKFRIVAIYYGMGGEQDKALEYLRTSIEHREINPAEALSTPGLAELREDKRFWELLDSAGVILPLDHRL